MATETVYIIKKESEEQTLESLKVLPVDIKADLSERVLTLEEFIHCINVANGLSDRNIAGEYKVSKEYEELSEEVMDYMTCGEYFIVIDRQPYMDCKGVGKCYWNRKNGEDCSNWSYEKCCEQLDYCEENCNRYCQCFQVGYLNDRLKEVEGIE